jgi:hypothetical protein
MGGVGVEFSLGVFLGGEVSGEKSGAGWESEKYGKEAGKKQERSEDMSM